MAAGVLIAGGQTISLNIIMKTKMQRKVFRVSHELFLDMYQGAHHYHILQGMPKDAKIIDMKFNGFDNRFEVLIESKTFGLVKEGNPYPIMDIVALDIKCKKREGNLVL